MAALRSGAPDDWDVELQRSGGHFLQSRAWQRVQAALGYEVVAERGAGWQWSGSVRAGRFPRYVYVPYGPAGTDLAAAIASITEAARSRALDFARIEPLSAPPHDVLAVARARRATSVQPRWTWLLDLGPSEEELRRGLSAGHRGSINAATRRGLEIARSAGDDAEPLIELQRLAAGRDGFRGQDADYYRTVLRVLVPLGAASLYIASAGSRAVAAAVCFDFDGTRYYAHAASDPDTGRKLGAAAPLVWQMILDARSAGMRYFDFWGVAPPGASHHRWAGFTRFKQAFGGRLVERPGAWELPIRSLRHRVFALAQTLKR